MQLLETRGCRMLVGSMTPRLLHLATSDPDPDVRHAASLHGVAVAAGRASGCWAGASEPRCAIPPTGPVRPGRVAFPQPPRPPLTQ